MKQSGSIVIDRPIELVFELTNKHIAEWSNVVVEDEMIEEKNGGGLGTTFRTVTEDHGRRMTFAGTVTAWEPPNKSAVHMIGSAFDIDATYLFNAVDGGTEVTQESTVNAKGFLKIVFMLFGGMMKKQSYDALNKEMQSLKAFCESYDGD